ncbi:MAG: hypothetical protein AAF418_05895 [Pseudomonadota bacterium]
MSTELARLDETCAKLEQACERLAWIAREQTRKLEAANADDHSNALRTDGGYEQLEQACRQAHEQLSHTITAIDSMLANRGTEKP